MAIWQFWHKLWIIAYWAWCRSVYPRIWSSCGSGWLRHGLNSSRASWMRPSNSVVTDSIVRAEGGHFEHLLYKKWLPWQLQSISIWLSNNLDFRKHIWITLLKMTFFTFQGSAATLYRWGRHIYNLLVLNFLWISCTKNRKNRMVFDVTLTSEPTITLIKINVCSIEKFVL